MARLDQLRIMVVEDEYYLATDVARALKRERASIVGPFGDREQAAAAVARGEVDCAVLDVNLGDGASFTLADEISAHGVRFIFFTGYDQNVIPERFASITRLEKPVGDVRLVQAIADACGTP